MTTPVTAAPAASTPAPTQNVEKITNPTTLETCDRCGAAGLWRLVLPSGNDLMFCGHHAKKYGIAGADSHSIYENENKTQGSDH